MGQIEIPGFLSGRPYRFNIAGDTPSATELQWMQGILSQEENRWQQEVGALTGFATQQPEAQPGTALGRGLQRGIPGLQSALGTAAEYAGLTGIGDYLQNAARERELAMLRENPALLEGTSYRDVRGLGSALTYAGELVGEQLPLIGGTLAAGAVTGGLGALAGLGTAGAVGLGTVAGTAAVSGPTLFGSNIERQEAEVAAGQLARVDVSAAANAALAQTGLELLSNLILVGRIPATLARAVAQNATVEGLTEIGQQALERQQAGLPVDSEDAIQEYLEAGIAGATLGAGFGGISGILGRRREEPGAPPVTPPSETAVAPVGEQFSFLDQIAPETQRAPLRPGQDAVRQISAEEIAARPELQGDLFPEPELQLRGGRAAETQPRLAELPTPSPRQLALDLQRPEIQGELPLVAPRGTQMDLFREGPPAAPEATIEETARVEPVAPAPASAPTITPADLDTLNVGRGAAVYQGVRSGALQGDAALDALLTYAQRIERSRADDATRVRNFVETQRAVAPRADETAAQLARVPEQDRADDAGARAGAESRGRGAVTEPRPVVSESAPGAAETAPGGLGDGGRDMGAAPAPATAQQPALTPEAEPETQAPTPAAPPAAPGQARPAMPVLTGRGTAMAPPAPAPAAPVTPAPPSALGEAARATAAQELQYADIEAQQALNDWFFANSSPELQRATREVADPTAQDPVVVRDKQAVLALLNQPFTAREQRRNNPAWGAFRYFNRNPRVNEVLDDIAFDFAEAQVDGTTYASGDGPYYAGKGGDYARGAAEWVRGNLSDASANYMDGRIAEYVAQIDDAAIDAAIEARDARVAEQREIQVGQMGEGVRPSIQQRSTSALDAPLTDVERGIIRVRGVSLAAGIAKTYGDTTKPRFMSALGRPLIPEARRALERGDLETAVQGLTINRNDRIARLARALLPAARSTAVQVVSAQEMQDLQRRYYGDTGRAFSGLFRADAGLQTIYLNREAGMDVSTVLHELVHAATWRTVQNESSPIYRQLEQLRVKLEAAGFNPDAVRNVDELLAEGMSNESFRQLLAQTNLDGSKETGLQRFTRTLVNAVRRLVGLPARSEMALDAVDQQFELILRTGLMNDSAQYFTSPYMAPRMRGELMNGMKGRIANFGPEAKARFDRIADNTTITDSAKSWILRGAVPLRNLVDLAKPYFPNAEQVYKLIEQHGADVHAGNQRIMNTVDAIGAYLKANPDKTDTFNDMRLLASLYQIDPRQPEQVYRRFRLYYDVLDSNGRFLRRVMKDYATREERNAARKQLNAQVPKDRTAARNLADPKPEDIEIYRKLRSMYQELGPEGQRAYAQALGLFEHLHRRTADVIRARLEALLPGQKDAQERIFGDIYRKVFADNLIVPYQPLQRRGNLWLTYRVVEGDADAQGVEYKEAFETEAERNEAIRALAEIPEVDQQSIQPYNSRGARNQRQTVPLQFAADVLNTVDRAMASSQMDAAAREALQQQITDLIFDASPERSYIQTYRARRNIRGFLGDPGVRGERLTRQDTVQLLKDKGFSINRQLADMEYGPKLQAEFNQMETTLQNIRRSGRDPIEAARLERRAQVYANVLNEYGDAIRTTRNQLSRTITSGTYGLTLGFNVSTAALTFMQFPTIIVPYLSGRYGLRATSRALGNASRVLTGSGRTRVEEFINERGEVETRDGEAGRFDYSLTNYNFDDPKNAALSHYRELASEMKTRGMANRSITEDILDFDNPDNLFQRMVSFSGIMQHHAERYTRETTAIAAYDMELRRIAQETGVTRVSELSTEQRQQAADRAIYQTEMTNGTILAAGAPLLAQGNVGAIIYLYKRFGLHMYNLLANTLMRWVGKNADPADRRIARMQFAGIMGSVALFAGAQGMPMFQMVANLFDLFFTDDDEEDFQTLTRLALGELGYKGIVDYTTGLSISGRIGLSGMFYREPFNAENQPWLFSQLEAIGGPAVGLAIRYTDRVPALLADGDIWRATEAMLPSAIANPLRAIRYTSEGVETLRGDPILGDVSPLSAAAQFIGFAPAEYVRQLEQNRVYTRIDRAIGAERTDLLRRRYVAYRQGDREAYREIMRDIREFNRRHPQAAITAETLETSLRSHRDTTSNMHHGVLFSTANREMLQRMAERWDAPSVWG